MKRFGYFGGSFDPVQRGHLSLARAALKELKLDRVYLVPARQSPLKTPHIASAAQRKAMLRLALRNQQGLRPASWDLEKPGRSYTHPVLRRLKKNQPRTSWFLIIGGDSYRHFTRWRKWKSLLNEHTLVVGRRKGFSGTDVPKKLQRRVIVLKGVFPGVSSTEVRRRVKRGLSIAALIAPRVSSYILRRGLYR